jgi:hypothetical protein
MMMVNGTPCPTEMRCKSNSLEATKNIRVTCAGGLHGKFLMGPR